MSKLESKRGLGIFIAALLVLQVFSGLWHDHGEAVDHAETNDCVVCVGLGQASGPSTSVAETVEPAVIELYSVLKQADVIPFDIRISNASPRGPPASL